MPGVCIALVTRPRQHRPARGDRKHRRAVRQATRSSHGSPQGGTECPIRRGAEAATFATRQPNRTAGRRAVIRGSSRRCSDDVPGDSLVGVGHGRMFMQRRNWFGYPLLPRTARVVSRRNRPWPGVKPSEHRPATDGNPSRPVKTGPGPEVSRAVLRSSA
jgi:hypothetical protein